MTMPASYFNDDISTINLSELQQLQGWQARYKQLVNWGRLLARKPDLQQECYRVRGCDTAAWVAHRYIETADGAGRHEFAFDADSKIILGLAALLLSQLQGRTSLELQQLDIESLLAQLDLQNHLSPSRSNGFLALSQQALKLALG